jgi:hypothetical protein
VVLPLIAMAVLFFQMTRIVWSYLHVRALKLGATPAPPELQRSFENWTLSTRVRRSARLLLSPAIASPMAVGFRHPAVILPGSLPDHLSAGELDQVLLHELAHLARRDDWTNLWARVAGAFMAWHPVAVWVLRRIEREREMACDAWVVSHTGEARPYAQSLARMFELCWTRRRVLLASGMAGHASQLGGRIEELLRSRRAVSAKASVLKIAFSILALAVLALAAAGTPRWIAFARSAPPAPFLHRQTARTSPAKPTVDVRRNNRGPALIAANLLRGPAMAPVLISQATPQKTPGPPKPAPAQAGFLAALVAAGYGDLSVDEIIELKNAGLTPEYLKGMSESGWGKLPPKELIALRNHGVKPDYAADMLESGVTDLSIARVIDLHSQGVPADFPRQIHALGFGPFDSQQIIDLRNHGVRVELFRGLKDAGFRSADPREIVEASSAGLRENDFREARQYGPGLTLRQIIKLKQAGVWR